MNKLLMPLLLVLLAISMPAEAKEPIRIISGVVVNVIDGNTLIFNSEGKQIETRLFGIDAPEIIKITRKSPNAGQLHGEESQAALASKVLNKQVQLDVMDVDRRGRIVSIVKINGRDINQDMVAEGHAWVYGKFLDKTYASEYLKAEEDARMARRGLWAHSKPQPPWEFRRALKGMVIDGF